MHANLLGQVNNFQLLLPSMPANEWLTFSIWNFCSTLFAFNFSNAGWALWIWEYAFKIVLKSGWNFPLLKKLVVTFKRIVALCIDNKKAFMTLLLTFTAALTEVYWPTNIARHKHRQENQKHEQSLVHLDLSYHINQL